LHSPRWGAPESPDLLEIDRSRDDFDIFQGKLAALSHDVSVDDDHGTALEVRHQYALVTQPCREGESKAAYIVIQSISSGPPTVGVEINTPVLPRGLQNELHPDVELSQAVVRPRTVGEDLSAGEAHADMGSVGSEQLFAGFGAKAAVRRADDGVANRDLDGFMDVLHRWRKVVFLDVAGSMPWNEPSILPASCQLLCSLDMESSGMVVGGPGEHTGVPIVAVRGEVQLGSDQDKPSIQRDDPGVEPVAPVHDRHPDIQENIVATRVGQDAMHHLPAVQVQITWNGVSLLVAPGMAGSPWCMPSRK